MIYDDGIKMNEENRVIECPVCKNEEFGKDAAFCRICGIGVFNMCEGMRIHDSYGNFEEFVQHKCHGNARFCEICGEKTEFFKKEILCGYKDYIEK